MAATVFDVSRLNLNGVFMEYCTLRLGWFRVSAIVIEDIHVGFSCVGESVHYTGLPARLTREILSIFPVPLCCFANGNVFCVYLCSGVSHSLSWLFRSFDIVCLPSIVC